MIPDSATLSDPAWAAACAADPVVQRYRALFAQLDWAVAAEPERRPPAPGSPGHPRAAYIKALLVKVNEGFAYITQLRRYLVAHPWLVLDLGFRPIHDPTQPWGLAAERMLPGERWLRHQQHDLEHTVLQRLLAGTVHDLVAADPALATTVAVDVKHSYAWVQENNPKEQLPERYDPDQQPRADPDCRLGTKRTTNQAGTSPRTTWLWGYGTGISSATTPTSGDIVLAETTQPFNMADCTYFQPLYDQVVERLGQRPINVTADAAFDAWHVYQVCTDTGGMAAIPLNERGPRPVRSAEGHPVCDQGHVMRPTSVFRHEDGYQAQHYRCPLLAREADAPGAPGEACCPDARFAAGGCRKVVNLEAGGQLRLTLDRTTPAYQALYRQRTSAERINSQATALGIERPKVRRLAAVQRLNTLIYLLINARALQRRRVRLTQAAGLC